MGYAIGCIERYIVPVGDAVDGEESTIQRQEHGRVKFVVDGRVRFTATVAVKMQGEEAGGRRGTRSRRVSRVISVGEAMGGRAGDPRKIRVRDGRNSGEMLHEIERCKSIAKA